MVKNTDIFNGLNALLKMDTPVTLVSRTGEVILENQRLEYEYDVYGSGVPIGFYVSGFHLHPNMIRNYIKGSQIVIRDKYLKQFKKRAA